MEVISSIVDCFNHPFFIIIGGLSTSIAVLVALYQVVRIGFGITPIVFRIGIALWKRKVAVFATAEVFNSLEATLTDTGIFKKKNVIHIPVENIDKAKNETVYVVDWDTFHDQIDHIFAARGSHQTPVIIIAKPGSIRPEIMIDIANRSNTVVVNFRGRLLNDILTSLITTSYEKK